MSKSYQHFINGEIVQGVSGRSSDIYDPSLGEVSGSVALANASEMDSAVAAAKAALAEWSATNPQRRARVLFNFKSLVEAHADELALILSEEHGKVLADSHGDIQRGLDVIEFACGVPHLLKGEYTQGAGPGIDVYSMRQPVGVAAGITPFNFPAMIPMWMFGVAIATGCTFVLKPSEKDPGVPLRLAELMMEAGAPAGVLNVVNGDKEAVDAIINHADIRAVSFVGSSDIAHYVYQGCAAQGKRRAGHGWGKKPRHHFTGRGYGPSGSRHYWRSLWLCGRTLYGAFHCGGGWERNG
jgi:malonate-semialdehyde dehydrogenase (acetylating)/methylmalonate-semialdehyde dehydrogenase